MAFIDNIYIHVTDENMSRPLEASSHSVEEGFDITDSVKMKASTLSLSGKIVDYNAMKAYEVISALYELQKKGALVTYSGRNVAREMQIRSFDTSHPNTNTGGADFSMELTQVRIAKNAYQTPKGNNAGTQQISNGDNEAVYHTVKKGDSCWNLITNTYKALTRGNGGSIMTQCQWIMDNNQHAFSRKNDFKTLQIGKKILVGYRK